MPRLTRMLRRFVRNDEGAVMTEAIVILPLLLWAYVALFVYWDAYRAENTAVKASYTIADMVTREKTDLTPVYINGLKTVFDYLMDSDQETGIIVSCVTWDPVDKRHEVVWSQARGVGVTAQTTATIQKYKAQLPEMADFDSAIVVQTNVSYVPAMEIGVPSYNLRNFIVTRPRFSTMIGYIS